MSCHLLEALKRGASDFSGWIFRPGGHRDLQASVSLIQAAKSKQRVDDDDDESDQGKNKQSDKRMIMLTAALSPVQMTSRCDFLMFIPVWTLKYRQMSEHESRSFDG
ncbi:hypothetical protein M378DRAFT_160947 [Amanita muscaria Koide BX008]|uniref:Uncharacterized protein n=1 Tax=Amanita muscaria (strain Koide BX008) TaxID=946122 RepID=A0A0C2XAY0_AMAMK|nr:hypothetical protein M378DRAFT_160947 [Amanita muscaria Koide BX008]